MADLRRRALLKRLGLAVGAVYVAPVLLPLSGARGSEGSGGSTSASSSSGASFSAPARSTSGSFSRPALAREVVVLLPARASVETLQSAGINVLSSRALPLLDRVLVRIRLARGQSVTAARRQIAALVPGAVIEPNDLYGTSELTCDEDGCAAFEMVGWQIAGSCGARPRIGLIDTRVNAGHASLAGQRVKVLDMGSDDRPRSAAVHGTAVAALLVGRGDSRTPGLLPDAELLVAEAFFKSGGNDTADAYRLITALDRLASEKPLAINMSLAGPDNPLLAQAIEAVLRQGIAVVAAVGNGGPGSPAMYPAAYPGVVAVTAIDRDSRIYRQAGRGAHVSFAAPGVNLWTAASASGGRLRSGTSYAAPFVTAAIAVARQRDPSAPVAKIVAGLAARAVDLGDGGRDPVFGHGLLQLETCGF